MDWVPPLGKPASSSSPDGRYKVAARCSQTHCVVERADGREVVRFSIDPSFEGGPRFVLVNDAGAIALVDHRIKTLPRVGVVGLAYDGAVSTLELEQLLRHAKVERRDVVRLAQLGDQFRAEHSRHQDVEDRDIGRRLGRKLKRLFSVVRLQHLKPLLRQLDLEESKDARLVIDGQYDASAAH